MSDKTQTNKNGKRLYLENKFSQQLITLFIVGNALFTILQTNTMDVTARLGTFIMLNIVLTLLGFLVSVQQKIYAIKWGYIGIAMALFQLVQLLWIPAEIIGSMRLFLQLLLMISGGALLLASIVCIQRARERQAYIDEHDIDIAALQK